MWSSKNKKRIRLSRKLKWGIGKSQNTNTYFWAIGGICFVLAGMLIIRTGTASELKQSPTVLGASTSLTPEPEAPKLNFTDYEISRGETLFNISTKFNIPIETLAQLNDINPPFTLKAGDTIKIPLP